MRSRQLSDEMLLDRVLAAFADDGFDGASMREVCRRSEVSHNLLHKRYGSKEAVWYVAIDHGFHAMVQELAAGIVEAGEDSFDQLRGAMLRFVAVTRANPSLIRILHQESARPGPRYEYLLERYVKPINDVGLRPIQQLQAEGRVRPGPVPTVFFHLATYGLGVLSSHAGTLPWFGDADADVDADETAQLAVEMIIDSMRVHPR